MKLYCVVGGPPTLAVKQAFKILDIPVELIDVNFGASAHMSTEFAEKNPQKEIPVLDDDGFFLGESSAILQYLCDQHKPDSNLYPKDPKVRAIVNHRLCFNLSTYYRYIGEYVVAPIFYDYDRTPLGLKKVHIALDVLNTYLKQMGKKYVAADHLTIADLALFTSTMSLEAISFDFSQYEYVTKWYNAFKVDFPDLWEVAMEGIKEIGDCDKNRPDLSHMEHPIHPIRKFNK